MNAKNVLCKLGWDWSQVTSAVPGLANLPEPAWLSQGATGRVVLLDTPEYPQKNLYTTNWKNFQPELGIAYAIDNNTVLHAGAGIIYQGLGGLSTDWFSFYYNSNTFNQISSLDGQHWVSELSNDHGLGTFPMQSSGTNSRLLSAGDDQPGIWLPDLRRSGNLDQGGTTIGHFDSPQDYSWDLDVHANWGRIGWRRWIRHTWYSPVNASVELEHQQYSPRVLRAG